MAWAEPLDLDEVKAVGRACDCTVNDVLMATAAGALRHYMLGRGERVDGVTLRATALVNATAGACPQTGQSFWAGVPGVTGG